MEAVETKKQLFLQRYNFDYSKKVAVSKVNAEKAKLIQNTLNFVLESTPIGTPLANQKAASSGGRKKHTRKYKKHHK